MKKTAIVAAITTFLFACNSQKQQYDASGTFEVEETIVSAEASGKILALNIFEGEQLQRDAIVGSIDPLNLSLQKQEVSSSINALNAKTSDVSPQVKLLRDQISVQQSELDNLLHEQKRTQNLLQAGGATQKQLDELTSMVDVKRKQISVTNQQINVATNNVSTQNRSILSDKNSMEAKVGQIQDLINKTKIVNPVSGVVLTKYAEPFEVATSGKPLYKIADLSEMTLRAYITGDQFAKTKLGKKATVLVDDENGNYRKYDGTIEWISDKAEFTPKTIQTKDERANLVYAIKIKVKNDGYLKIGMYADVALTKS